MLASVIRLETIGIGTLTSYTTYTEPFQSQIVPRPTGYQDTRARVNPSGTPVLICDRNSGSARGAS